MKVAPQVRWKLPEVLEREGISIYRLDQELAKRVSRTTLYKWGSKTGPKQVDPEVMGWVLWGLQRITGHKYRLQDLLDIEAPATDDTGSGDDAFDRESASWLEAPLTEPLPPYDWGPEGEPEGQPVRYVENEGFVVIEDERA